MPNTIQHFEIPADDIERAKAFYHKVFGWKFESGPSAPGQEYFMVMAKDGDTGINGGLMKRQMPGQPFTNYVTVDSIDRMLSAVQAAGARVALPKQEIGGGMGWIAGFIDPESNLIGLHQPGPNAPRPAVAKKAPAKKAPAKKVAKPAARKSAKASAKKPGKKTKRGGKKRR